MKVLYLFQRGFMKKLKNIIALTFLISLLILIPSCTFSENEPSFENAIEVSIPTMNFSNMSDVVDTIRYVKLQQPYPDYAYQIDKVLIENDKIYIFDYYTSKALVVYDLEGNFQFSMSHPGQGPSEYLQVQDFLVDDGNIEILDSRERMIIYDSIGTFVRSEKLPFRSQSFTKDNGSYIFQTGKMHNDLGENGESCELIRFNIKTKKTTCIKNVPKDQFMHSFKERNILSKIGEDLLYSTYFNDTIYGITGNNFSYKFILNFGTNTLPKKVFNLPNASFVQFLNENGEKQFHTPHIKGSDNYFITSFRQNGANYLIRNRKKNTQHLLKGSSFNDIDGGFPLHWVHAVNNNEIITVVDPNYILDRMDALRAKEDILTDNEKRFIEFAQTLDINDPQLLIFYRLK